MRQLVVWGAALVVAAVLAFWLQGTIQEVCIVPVVGLLRMAGLLLRAVPQSVFWSLLVAGAAVIAAGSLARAARVPLRRRARGKQAAAAGPIGKLAQHFGCARRGPYFRWQVAHRLAELEQAIAASPLAGISDGTTRLDQCDTSKTKWPRGMGATGNGSQRPEEILAYMEAGLARPPLSHSRRRFLSRRHATPLDLDPNRVVEYLESQMENRA